MDDSTTTPKQSGISSTRRIATTILAYITIPILLVLVGVKVLFGMKSGGWDWSSISGALAIIVGVLGFAPYAVRIMLNEDGEP